MPKGYIQSDLVLIKYNRKRGKGGRAVYARKDINKYALIEWAPCIIVPDKEIGWNWNRILPWYVFQWDDKLNAIALGYVSMYNHSYKPNAYYTMEEPDCITIWAYRNIKKDEEITINYNGDPTNQTKVGFKVNGRNKSKLSKTKKTQ